jgi:hypothetical protein
MFWHQKDKQVGWFRKLKPKYFLSAVATACLAAAMIFSLTSCQPSASTIIGTWVRDNNEWKLTFFQDGSILVYVIDESDTFGATYSIEGSTLTFTAEWDIQSCEYKVNGNKLTLIPSNGEGPITLTKESKTMIR